MAELPGRKAARKFVCRLSDLLAAAALRLFERAAEVLGLADRLLAREDSLVPVVVSVELISRRSLRPSVGSRSIEAVSCESVIFEASLTRGAAPISWPAVG